MNSIAASNAAGYVPGKQLSTYFREVQKLKREDRLEEVIASLLELVDATEEDSLFTGLGVTSAYYEQLAIIYRKRKEYAKEIGILSRYARQRHTHADSRQAILRARLEKANELFTKDKFAD